MNPTTNPSCNVFKFAAIQMVSTEDVESNLQQAQDLIQQAAVEGASLVLLPENFAVFNAKRLYEWAQDERAAYLKEKVASWAKAYGLWIVAGTLPQRSRYPDEKTNTDGQRVRTSSIVFNPNGEQVSRYDKIHLFDVDVQDAHGAYRESETIEPGEVVTLSDIKCGALEAPARLGLSVCYDVRFPELYRELSSMGAMILTVPAAFTWETGKAHWESLLRARAIENQCYVIAANQGGQHTPTRQTWGHSMIIDPWGEVLAQQASGPGVVIANIDLELINNLKQRMPVQQHRRL